MRGQKSEVRGQRAEDRSQKTKGKSLVSSLRSSVSAALIRFFTWQKPVFLDRTTGVQILFCSRQIGKSFVLAAWAVDRLLEQLQKPENHSWLITVLSNSRDNGGEFALKVHEVANKFGQAVDIESNADELNSRSDVSEDVKFELMRFEIRITVNGKVGRIKILAANPRTARGFSGDLILDEFAFHQDSSAIWEAAEPILSRNPEFLCRIASTANGKHNMFYQMVTSGTFATVKVPRSLAYAQGLPIYDLKTREKIAPDQARAKALDKRAYDQNYECKFTDELGALLTSALIDNAEAENVGVICEQDWSYTALERCRYAEGDLFVGVDVGRTRDLTVISVGELKDDCLFIRAILRINNMRLPQQQIRLMQVIRLPKFRKCNIDMTGLGLGLCEYAQDEWNTYQIEGVHFSQTVPLSDPRARSIREEGRKQESVAITELMGVALMGRYESKRIKHCADVELRNDLLKPERVVTPTGRVRVAAVRSIEDHADHFWSFCLCDAAATAKIGGIKSASEVDFGGGPPRLGSRGERSASIHGNLHLETSQL